MVGNQQNWDQVQRLTLLGSVMTNRMPPGKMGSEIKSDELWGLGLIKMEVSEYGVAWLSVEYPGEVGSVYLYGLNTCMGEGDEAWLV